MIGLDFAWYLNGYVYHTKSDNAAHVPLGSLQRTGDNMMALVMGLVSADELTDTTKHKEGRVVFFDFLGAFLMFWTIFAGDIVHIVTLVLSIYSMMTNMKEAINRGLKSLISFESCINYLNSHLFLNVLFSGLSKKQYLKQLLACAGVVLQSWLLTLMVSILIALCLTALGSSLSWYARPVWIIFLYVIPSVTVPMLLLLYKSQHQRKVSACFCPCNKIIKRFPS